MALFSLPPFFYLFIYFKTFFGYEKRECRDGSIGAGVVVHKLSSFFLADSMYPVRQLRRDNRSILHMSVFL